MADRQDDVRVSRQLFQRLNPHTTNRCENNVDDFTMPDISSDDFFQLFNDDPQLQHNSSQHQQTSNNQYQHQHQQTSNNQYQYQHQQTSNNQYQHQHQQSSNNQYQHQHQQTSNNQYQNASSNTQRFEHAPWGTAHEDYKKVNPTRVAWTKQEKEYLGKLATEKLKISPGINNLMANCLVSIKADPAAVPIFHTFHIVNSARLRPGYEAYLKENGLQARRRKRSFAEDGPEYAPV
jgi:hypothetical protein